MASTARRMSTLTQELSSEEGWQDLVAWDDELYDPLFQGDIGIANTSAANAYRDESFTSDTHAPQSVTSEQSYGTSTVMSIFGEPSSFDYVVSRPPSVNEEPSSFGQRHSWLSGSPSYTTSATSPLPAQVEIPYQNSFEACETMLSPGHIPSASPFFDTHSHGSSSSYQTAPTSGLFNPHVAGTPHSFSGRDVYASQALENVGTWVEPSVEPIIEVYQEDGMGAIPIPIPHNRSQRLSNTFSSRQWNDSSPYHQNQSGQAQAITIPEPQYRDSNAHPRNHSRASLERHPSIRHQSQHWSRQVPPVLSLSPEQRRLPRAPPLTRSLSTPRRGRNGRLATPSPTSSNFGWVSYQPNTQHRLVPSGAEGSRRRQRGRVGALTAQQRSHAALMRLVGSCSNCKKRKEKCDPGTPCKSCIDHFKGDLVNHPCRDRLVSGLASVFLGERHGWHPTVRAIGTYFGNYEVAPGVYSIPISFGFGSLLHVPVSIVQVKNHNAALLHEHAVYSWPPNASSMKAHTHAVLPAILTPEAMNSLEELLDTHLTLLVDQHFSSFPLFCSPLRVLRHVYVYGRSLPTTSSYSQLLHQALKLLVLVHVGGDITLPSPSSDPVLEQLVRTSISIPEGIVPTPCFIRSQFGSIMPSLALKLMREILLSLEQLFLNRESQEWPIAVATLIVVLITVESIQYHASKLPYHHSHDTPMVRSQSKQERDFRGDDEGVRQLLEFYSACFSGCHARLSPDWRGDPETGLRPSNSKSTSLPPEDKFIENIREAIRNATPEYLEAKAREERIDDDMSYFFDRLAARLLVLKVGDVVASTSQNDTT